MSPQARKNAEQAYARQNSNSGARGQNAKQNKKKKTVAPNYIADVFNPLSRSLVPAPVSEGESFPVFGMARLDLNMANRHLLIFSNVGDSAGVGAYINPTAAPYAGGVMNIATMTSSATAGGPTSARAMKFGVSLLNVTPSLTRGGRVYVLNANQRFLLGASPSTMTEAQWDAVMDMVKAHPKVKSFSGSDFASEKTFVSFPTNDSDYRCYRHWTGTDTASSFLSHLSTYSGAATDNPRPMSTVFVVLDEPADTQNWSVFCRSAYYSRWPLNSVLGQSNIPVPTAPLQAINAAGRIAEALASHGRPTGAPSGAASAAGDVSLR
jgi:hypothetical protein